MDTLPDEILHLILSYLNIKTLLPLCTISREFAKFYRTNLHSLVYDNVSHRTRFDLKDYDIKRLLRLNKYLFKYNNIATGASHALISTEGGQMYSYGYNKYGQLGLSDTSTSYRSVPELISNLQHIIQISTMHDFSLILVKTGEVYGFGANNSGQLGLRLDSNDKFIPTLIPCVSNICYVSAGSYHALLLLNNEGQVYVYGCNTNGQLGLGDNYNRVAAKLNPNLYNVVSISAGYDHSLVLTSEGQVYAFGINRSGQLGLNHTNDINVPLLIPDIRKIAYISAGGYYSAFLTVHECVYVCECIRSMSMMQPILLHHINDIVQISSGIWEPIMILSNGNIMGFGEPNNKIEQHRRDIVQISGHVYLTDEGRVYIHDVMFIELETQS